jgi:hypothetical protein
MAETNKNKLWDSVYETRATVFQKEFGTFPDDILKIDHMTGVWPGGGLFKFEATKLRKGLWVYTTFGFTNPDMPTKVYPSNVNNEHQDGRLTRTELTLETKNNVPTYPGRPGYGYEIIVLTKGEQDWPLWFLQWAVNTEILNDADILGRVKKYSGLTIEDIMVGDDGYVNVLITEAQNPVLNAFELPNGKGKVLIATAITDDEMAWSMKNGRDELLKRLIASDYKQVSDLKRPSVLNPDPVDYSKVDSREKTEELASRGILRQTYLFPLEFGGQDDPINIVYLPKPAALDKKVFDQRVMDLAQQGKISNYSATPSYKSNSFIPESIQIEAAGEGGISANIEVW